MILLLDGRETLLDNCVNVKDFQKNGLFIITTFFCLGIEQSICYDDIYEN